MKRAILPVFLPPHDRGALIDPPCAPRSSLESIAARAKAALDAALAENKKPQLAWFGSSIGAHDETTRKTLLSIAKKRASQRVTLDPSHATKALLSELWSRGVRTIEVDVTSFDDEALAASGLAWRSPEAAESVARVKAAGFETGVVVRPGLPGGTMAETLRTGRRAAELAPAFVRIYPVLVLAGSRLEAAFESRRYRPLSIEEAIGVCRELVKVFEAASIPVSRLGLQPQVDVDGAPEVVTGPWHPSLRTLVEGSIWYERALALVRVVFRFQRDMTLVVAPCDETRLRGPQGLNVRRLKEKFRLRTLAVRVDDSRLPGTLELEAVDPVSLEVVRRAG